MTAGEGNLAGEERGSAVGRFGVVNAIEFVARIVAAVVPRDGDRAIGLVDCESGLPGIVLVPGIQLHRRTPMGTVVGGPGEIDMEPRSCRLRVGPDRIKGTVMHASAPVDVQ